MADSIKGAISTFYELEILISGDSPIIFPSLDKMCNFIVIETKKMTLLKQFIKLEWMSISLFHEGFKSSLWLNS